MSRWLGDVYKSKLPFLVQSSLLMHPKDPAPTEDLLQIQIAIELDRGRKVAEIASEFQVPEKKVRTIARNAGLLGSKKSTSARKRLSEEEKEEDLKIGCKTHTMASHRFPSFYLWFFHNRTH